MSEKEESRRDSSRASDLRAVVQSMLAAHQPEDNTPLAVGERTANRIITESGVLGLIAVALIAVLLFIGWTVGRGLITAEEKTAALLTGVVHQQEGQGERIEDVERELRELRRTLGYNALRAPRNYPSDTRYRQQPMTEQESFDERAR